MDLALPNGDDLALSRGTDFYGLDELLTDPEREIRDRVRVWCDTEVSPAAADYWERAEFPVELVKGYAALGIAGASIVGDGCPGLSYLAEGMIAAELARGDGSIATLNAVHSGLAMTTIAMLGSAEQRAQYLPRMAACEVLGAFALTEPAARLRRGRAGNPGPPGRRRMGAGRARSDGSATAPSPASWWSGPATTTATSVRSWSSTPTARSTRSPATTPGRSPARPRTAACGRRRSGSTASGYPPTRDWPRPAPGTTPTIVLAKSRQTVAWEALGHAIAAYEAALTYSLRREQFGRPLARFQLIQDKLSHMLSDITGMQLMCTRMSQLQAQGRISIEHAALAKLNTGDAARRVCAMARDILGGNGILLDHHVARHHADIEAVYTYEGTDSIQSLIVGRAITGINAFR